MKLLINQSNAIKKCIENDFASGVIAHATGTGKSITGINIINEYIQKNNVSTIFWICEYKFIVKELFLNEKFKSSIDILNNKFNIFDFSINKDKNWVDKINLSNKPCIIFINRAFLTIQQKYKNIKKSIDLIIHDECHSIKNKTTTEFYQYLKEFSNFKAIGLSATPLMKYPFDNIIHSYTLYDALCNKSIVTPKITWFSKDGLITPVELINEIKILMKDLVYKKAIIWCGLINVCNQLAYEWQRHFDDYTICIDTSKSNEINGFDTFKNKENNAFLFCAAKHREGSDIKNLDCCIFMDKVSKRTPKTFLQCVGRVLRLQKNKTEGLIIDIKAKSAYDVIKRMAIYLNNNKTFPYSYTYKYNENYNIKINNLVIKDNNNNEIKNECFINDISIDEIKSKFKRKIPNDKIYIERFRGR